MGASRFNEGKVKLFYNFWYGLLHSIATDHLTPNEKEIGHILSTILTVDNLDVKINIIIELIQEQEKIDNIKTIETVSEVCLMGANKYGHKNYTKGFSIELVISCSFRHLIKGIATIDKESGLPAWSHLLSNLFILRENYK